MQGGDIQTGLCQRAGDIGREGQGAGASHQAPDSTGNLAGQRDSGKPGACGGLARLAPGSSRARLGVRLRPPAGRSRSAPYLALRQPGDGSSASHSTRTWLREPAMNQPDSIQKSRPGLCRQVLPGSRLPFGFLSRTANWRPPGRGAGWGGGEGRTAHARAAARPGPGRRKSGWPLGPPVFLRAPS